jgi:hypothetical protein
MIYGPNCGWPERPSPLHESVAKYLLGGNATNTKIRMNASACRFGGIAVANTRGESVIPARTRIPHLEGEVRERISPVDVQESNKLLHQH